MIACPSCGHHFHNPDMHKVPTTYSTLDQHTPWAQQAEVPAIQEKIRQLDDLIYRINEERAILLRKTNAIQSFTRHFPPEILSNIFQYSRPPIDFNSRDTSWSRKYYSVKRGFYAEDDFHFVLGSVSHYWRQVVCATPQLWTSLSISLDDLVEERDTVSLLELYFQRSGTLPMALELDLTEWLAQLQRDNNCEGRALIPSLLNPLKTLVFIENGERIQELIFGGAPTEWAPCIEKSITRCESLTLLWSYPDPTPHENTHISFQNLRCLDRVRIESGRMKLNPSFSTVTILQLRYAPIRVCMEILMECPNLIQFDSRDSDILDTDDSPITFPETVVIENLEILKVYINWRKWDYEFFRRFRFSKLRFLRCKWYDLHPDHPNPEDASICLRKFFSSLPPTLENIRLPLGVGRFNDLKDILGSVPHLEDLEYGKASSRNLLGMIGHPVAGLSEGEIQNGRATINVDPTKSDGPRFLSTLKTLGLNIPVPRIRGIHLVDMLETLYATRPVTEPLLIWTTSRISLDQGCKDRLRGLRERGVQFEIRHSWKGEDISYW